MREIRKFDSAECEAWAEAGAPEGDTADLPPAPRFTEGWQLGQPDLVVKVDQPYTLKAVDHDEYRCFVVPLNLKDTKYVRAIELRPGNKRVVHHANIWIDRKQSLRRRDGEDGQPGFPGMENVSTEARSDFFDPDSHFLFWKPGTVIEPSPAHHLHSQGLELVPGHQHELGHARAS